MGAKSEKSPLGWLLLLFLPFLIQKVEEILFNAETERERRKEKEKKGSSRFFFFFFFSSLVTTLALPVSEIPLLSISNHNTGDLIQPSVMVEEFVKAVEDGLKLSKRIYFGKDRSVSPPKAVAMEKSSRSHLPTAPMFYAVIPDPSIVDNPDIPSYQPHVHGRCDPPALIPLQMNGIEIQADCYLDTAIVKMTGSWRVHCVMGSRKCDCRFAIPMGHQGSILGVQVDVNRRSYSTQLTSLDESIDMDKVAKPEDGGFLKPQIFTLLIPQVDGGSNLSVKVSWSQKLVFDAGHFSLNVPFTFPEYVIPAGKRMSKREKLQLNVNLSMGTEVLCKTTSHPLKELRRQAGTQGFLYEADVIAWSTTDFNFSYGVSSSNISGGLLLQSPSADDLDQREMFCLYLYPGNNQTRKVFRRKMVFVIDTSESMKGKPLENVKNALSAALSKLNPEDSFSIIAFNGETYLFSSSLMLATEEAIQNATQWISINFIAGGGTNILQPLNQAIEMLSDISDSIPLIFLITDGSVEDERHICDVMKSHMSNRGSMFPRISTFGIGTYCNHYFLQMLALVGRGYYDAAYDIDSIDVGMQKLLDTASSLILANIAIDSFEHLDALEVYPSKIPDLSCGSLLIVSGRYQGNFPDVLKARGILADMSNHIIDLKVQQTEDIPLDKVFGKKQIGLLTAEAWFNRSKQLEDKAAKLSIRTGIPSEYTRMIVLQTERGESARIQEVPDKIDLKKMVDSRGQKIILLQNLGVSFGNSIATAENLPPGFGEHHVPEPAADVFVKAASNCCSRIGNCCCCFCCIRSCSRVNDQCGIVFAQLCAALSCFGCLSCCDACANSD